MSEDASPYGRGELTRVMDPARVREVLASQWHPYPRVEDRDAWQVVGARCGDDLLAAAEAAVVTEWPALPATLLMDYARTGNRTRAEAVHFARRALLRDLVLGACVSGADRLLDPVVDAVWALCEETFWGVPAHAATPGGPARALPADDEPVIDLFAAETGVQLAWTVELLGPRLAQVAPGLVERVHREIDRRLLSPFLLRDDWHWMAAGGHRAGNWTTWVCSNLIACTLLTETDPDRRARLISRTIASLDVFVASMPEDGACGEGQSYWSRAAGSLFDALDALESASGGALDGFGLPVVRAASRYLPGMHVTGRTFVQHADGHIEFLAEPITLYRLGRRVADAEARQLAVHLRDAPTSREEASVTGLWRQLQTLFDPDFLTQPAVPPPAVGTRWFDRQQVFSARERPGRSDGLLLVGKGGDNDEPHNHNDVGSFALAVDGRVLVVDPGVEAYTAATFGPRRYQLWPLRSDWHNLPVVNGQLQQSGAGAAARDVAFGEDGERVRFAAELSAAWPQDSGLTGWWRRLELDRVQGLVELSEEWTLRRPGTVALPLALSAEPVPDGPDLLVGTDRPRLRIAVQDLHTRIERHELTDPGLQRVWGPALWRLTLTPPGPAAAGRYRIRFSRVGR